MCSATQRVNRKVVDLISVQNLSKKFELDDPKKLNQQDEKDMRLRGRFFHSLLAVDFQCDKGQVLGLLGPNGAGKTTTLRILSTALTPNSGKIVVDGEDLTNKPHLLRKKIGFLSGSTGLYGRLTSRENIQYFGRLHGMPQKLIDERINSMADELGMHSFLERRCETFSTGMKQKTAIARAVIHQPEVVILDEPTTGLDIMATETVMAFIQRLKAQQVSVIFSTHHLNEVHSLCDNVCVINEGTSTFNGALSEFEALSDVSMHQAFLMALKGAN